MTDIKGNYRTPDGKAQIDFELTHTEDKPRFSATGNYNGSLGQCLAKIATAYPNDATVQRLHAIWKLYHRNDMRPGCEHQRAENWGTKKITVVTVEVATWQIHHQGEAVRQINALLRDGRPVPLASSWPLSRMVEEIVKDAKRGIVYQPKTEAEASWIKSRIIQIKQEAKYSGHVYPQEHPEGVLTKPCPVCGYKYGSAWLYMPIPATVIEEVNQLAAAPALAPLYEDQAKNFLSSHGLTMRISLSDSKPAPWEPSGHHYRVTVSRDRTPGSRLAFDFWGSASDAEKGVDPTPYDILSCISSDATMPGTFPEYCRDFGEEEDSRRALQTFRRADRFAQRLRAFFQPEEIEVMQEIR